MMAYCLHAEGETRSQPTNQPTNMTTNLITPTITETAANYVDHLGGVALLISSPSRDSYSGRLAVDSAALSRCNYLAEAEADGLAVVWTDCPMTAETLWETSDVCSRLV